MADAVVRVSFERDGRKCPSHPHVEGIVQKQIRQRRADNPTLRSSCRTRNDTTILHPNRGLQPAFDVELHPWAVRMGTNRLEEQAPIDAVEVALDVDIEHPVVTPASLTRCPDCVDGRAAWSISIGILMEDGLQDGFQISLDDFLGNAIGDRWNTKRPLPAPPGLRD